MKKIKVAHILNSVGGVDVSLRLILGNLSPDKFECIVVHGKDDTKVPFINFEKKQIADYQTNIVREISLFKDFRAIKDTYKQLKIEKPDVIHAHSAKGGVIGRIVGYFLGINVLVTPQAFSYLSTPNRIKKHLYLFIEKMLRTKRSFILASSKSEMDRAILDVGYKKNNVLLFNNSIEKIKLDKSSIEQTWPENYICTVGRPTYQKNLQMMIRIMKKVVDKRDIHLVIMGVGHNIEELGIIKKLIADFKLSKHITLLEWTERNDVLNIISKSKFYISTARYEGLPYSIIESLALSKPAIVTDCDGNKDLIRDNINGFVIIDNDESLFCAKIVQLLDDNVLLEKMARNAYGSFCGNYDMKANIRQLENIYYRYSNID